MSILTKVKSKVKVARDSYAKYQAEVAQRGLEKTIRDKEKVEEAQSKLESEVKHLNTLAARRERTNKLKRDLEVARLRLKQSKMPIPKRSNLPKRKPVRITPKRPKLRR